MLAKLLTFQELLVFAEKVSFFGLNIKKEKKKSISTLKAIKIFDKIIFKKFKKVTDQFNKKKQQGNVLGCTKFNLAGLFNFYIFASFSVTVTKEMPRRTF